MKKKTSVLHHFEVFAECDRYGSNDLPWITVQADAAAMAAGLNAEWLIESLPEEWPSGLDQLPTLSVFETSAGGCDESTITITPCGDPNVVTEASVKKALTQALSRQPWQGEGTNV